MPTRPGSFRPKHQAPRAELRRQYDAHRRETQPWRALYKTAAWQAIRLQVLADEPLCRRCTARHLVVPATVVNHVERHQGDPVAFFAGPFEPLCKPCHDSEVQREERAASAEAAAEAGRRGVGRKSGA